MKLRLSFSILAFFFFFIVNAQDNLNAKRDQTQEYSFGFSKKQASISVAYYYNWKYGKKNKFYLGLGGRFIDAFSMGNEEIYFTSAKASLENDASKRDSLILISPNSYSLNLSINGGYHFTPRFSIGGNIDIIGFTLGRKYNCIFISEGNPSHASVKPTTFNNILFSKSDRGTLIAKIYLQYKMKNDYGIRVAYQKMLWEYIANSNVQTIPEQNNRFRNKVGMLNIGVSYTF
jgi:hypothetical protein